jgi:hypothetical protein
MDTRSLSYDELASLLSIERESARHLAFRRRWRRSKGNDGKARVDVPLEALPHAPDSPTGAPTGDEPASCTDSPTGSAAVLERHIERLEAMLSDAEVRLAEAVSARDAACDEARDAQRAQEAIATQVEALNAVLAVERQRAEDERRRGDEMRAERDAWREQAVRPRGLLALFRRRA